MVMTMLKRSVMKKLTITMILIFLILVGVVHFILPGLIENETNHTVPHKKYVVTPIAEKLHQQLFVADLHSDSLLWKRNLLQHSERGHMDVPRLQEGNVAFQVFTAVTKVPSGQNYRSNAGDSDNITFLAMAQLQPLDTWFGLYERAQFQLQKLTTLDKESEGRLKLIKTRQDLQTVLESRAGGAFTIAGVFGIEGAHPLEGDIANLDRLYESGMRVIGLTHFFDNRLGGSLHGVSKKGLTEFGKKVVRRANQLKLVIDVAHSSPQMVKDVLAISTRPVILSHGGIKSVCDRGRNLSDQLMVQLAQKGGLLGLGYWRAAVCDFTPQGIVNALRRAIDVMGVDHVALGSDYDGATTVRLQTSELAILTQTMMDKGFTNEEIRKVMGDNVKQFFLSNLPEK